MNESETKTPACPDCQSERVEVRHESAAVREWMKEVEVPAGVMVAKCHACGAVHFPDPSNLWAH